MFGHAVNNMKNRLRASAGTPAAEKKFHAVIGCKPPGGISLKNTVHASLYRAVYVVAMMV
jgi:hypothetical protein